jgi:hypothetical protein
MLRRLFLAAILAAPAVLIAQQPIRTMAQPATTQPHSPATVVVPSSPSIFIVSGPSGVYLTPLATLPLQQIGISLAGREGISMETPLQTGVITAVPSPYNFGAPIAFPGVLSGGVSPAYAGGEGEGGRLINDLGPSYYAGETATIGTAPSLGEYARAYKKSHPRAVRIFTNIDAEHMSNSVDIPGATAPNQQQNPPVKPPPQKENLKEDSKPQIPRSTASVPEPGRDVGQP